MTEERRQGQTGVGEIGVITRLLARIPFIFKYIAVYGAIIGVLAMCAQAQRQPKAELFPITARCVDGTYSRSTGSGTCAYHGGVASWL